MNKPLRRIAFEAFDRPEVGDDEAEYRYQRDEHQWERVARALTAVVLDLQKEQSKADAL